MSLTLCIKLKKKYISEIFITALLALLSYSLLCSVLCVSGYAYFVRWTVIFYRFVILEVFISVFFIFSLWTFEGKKTCVKMYKPSFLVEQVVQLISGCPSLKPASKALQTTITMSLSCHCYGEKVSHDKVEL